MFAELEATELLPLRAGSEPHSSSSLMAVSVTGTVAAPVLRRGGRTGADLQPQPAAGEGRGLQRASAELSSWAWAAAVVLVGNALPEA